VVEAFYQVIWDCGSARQRVKDIDAFPANAYRIIMQIEDVEFSGCLRKLDGTRVGCYGRSLHLSVIFIFTVCALVSGGCYTTRWGFRQEPETSTIFGHEVRFFFDQEDWSVPVELDKGDTSFVLLVVYRCQEVPCNMSLEVAEPLLSHSRGRGTTSMHRIRTYPGGSTGFTQIQFGPFKPIDHRDTVSLTVPLSVRDQVSGAVIDKREVKVLGVPTRDRTTLIEALIQGV
jgi:hypothetical protein